MYGHRPDVHLGGAELRVVRRDHEVAREREAEASGQRVPAHPRDRRLAQRPELAEQRGQQAASVVRSRGTRVLGDAAEVRTGAERPVAGPGEDHHPHRIVGLRGGDRIPQALHHAVGHRVAAFGSVDRDACDAGVDRVQHFSFWHARIVGSLPRGPLRPAQSSLPLSACWSTWSRSSSRS